MQLCFSFYVSRLSVVLLSGLLAAGIDMHAADRPNPGLVLHLRLNEARGDRSADSSGRGHHAKLVNTQWVEFGIEGAAVRLTGDKSYIDIGRHRDFDFTQDFTLSLWMIAAAFDHGSSLFNYGNYTSGWQTYVFRSYVALSSRALKGPSTVWYRKFATGTSVSYPFT